MQLVEHKRGTNTIDLYESLMEETKYDQRLLVVLRNATGAQTMEVTKFDDFADLDKKFRSGKFIARAFYRDDGWGENVIARVYNGPLVCVQQVLNGECLPKLARAQEAWAKCADGVVRCVALYDPSIVGEFQSSAEPVEQIAIAIEE